MFEELDGDIVSVAALGEPVRRNLYRYVVAQDRPVGREQAAAGVGVAHHVAKFNLDKLVTDGLLEVEYSRPPGRTGPGAGRPAKLYRRATRDISVTLPERHYDLAGHVMGEAITIAMRDAVPVGDALRKVARATGRRLGETAEPAGLTAPLEAVSHVLACNGYEPRAAADGLILANCPFHRLAENYTELVCGLNLDLIDGLLDAIGHEGVCARLDPGPGRCCVTLGTSDGEHPAGR
ncbi:transcriptional regulator [Sphaerisporangium flaviroseum]|uniref:Transcriptional regulator n=1 Tax=Sphaerisporangium flaviroseum TaxID=509199 RepID=A0ABP7IYE4_9ACTN